MHAKLRFSLAPNFWFSLHLLAPAEHQKNLYSQADPLRKPSGLRSWSLTPMSLPSQEPADWVVESVGRAAAARAAGVHAQPGERGEPHGHVALHRPHRRPGVPPARAGPRRRHAGHRRHLLPHPRARARALHLYVRAPPAGPLPCQPRPHLVHVCPMSTLGNRKCAELSEEGQCGNTEHSGRQVPRQKHKGMAVQQYQDMQCCDVFPYQRTAMS